jgi:Hemerythrin HHE cation binding domain
MDITQLILDDHHEQRRLFAILEQIESADTGALTDVWGRLAAFLEVHAAAEEAIFYPELVRLAIGPRPLTSAEPETIDAIYDHNEIRDAVTAVSPHAVGSPGWREAVAAANLANSDHMAEEERQGLTDFRRRVTLAERHRLAVAFAAFEARHVTGVRPVDKDPQQYVRQIEEAAQDDQAPGSLRIGGLKA